MVLEFLESRPEPLFRKFIADPVPTSVTIEHAESRLSQAVVFLHFTIAPTDMEQIMARQSFSEQPYKDPIQEPSWFRPKTTFRYWSADGGTKQMWFLEEKRLAYFKQVNP